LRKLQTCLVTAAIGLAGCGSSGSGPSPSAVASPEVVCGSATWQPTASLTCGPAIAAALAALPGAHAPIIREEFRWGGLCPPGAPCAPPMGDAGIVIIDYAGTPSLFVYVNALSGGVVAASSPAPYPSGY
jgi:hypothetical protein